MQTDNLITEAVLPPPPVKIPYRLCFDHFFQCGHGKYDYLQFVRSRGLLILQDRRQFEETYWRSLEHNRTDFAAQLPDRFDLLVDPPSNSGYHRPFLSAFARQLKGVPCVHFLKNTHKRAHPDTVGILRATVKASGTIQGKLGKFINVLIVDDVFSSGTIGTVVIEKLREAGLPQTASITVACPLRMPPKDDPTMADVRRVLQQPS
jgi:hypothetical protein